MSESKYIFMLPEAKQETPKYSLLDATGAFADEDAAVFGIAVAPAASGSAVPVMVAGVGSCGVTGSITQGDELAPVDAAGVARQMSGSVMVPFGKALESMNATSAPAYIRFLKYSAPE